MRLHPATPAIAAAILFGISTPLAKLLVGEVAPLLLAGLLYLGSGLGLAALLVGRRALRSPSADTPAMAAPIRGREWVWLLGAIAAGGVAGPALLMTGLARIDAASASLLLNLESVFTALIAWLVFRENADRRIVLGMLAIVAGGAVLAWHPGRIALAPGALLVAAACLCWAVDNNLTRKVSGHDAMFLTCCKGLVAGVCNTALAFASGASLPAPAPLGWALLVGFAGYGVSLALFVVGLRTLGTSRTAAYFSIAPLFGVALAFAIWPEVPSVGFWIAAALMVAGLALHLRERHVHAHAHEPMAHSHPHVHDAHHRHAHDFAWDGREPHVHPHEHAALAHAHVHYPDIHHRHSHQ